MILTSRSQRRRRREWPPAPRDQLRIVLMLATMLRVLHFIASATRRSFEEFAGVSAAGPLSAHRIGRLLHARLALDCLEGRLAPSVSPFRCTDAPYEPEVAQFRNDATSLDFLVRLAPGAASSDSRSDFSGSAANADGPLGLIAVTATLFGSAAVFPYDPEEDADAPRWLHGVQVA